MKHHPLSVQSDGIDQQVADNREQERDQCADDGNAVFITRLNTILRTMSGFAQQGFGQCTVDDGFL